MDSKQAALRILTRQALQPSPDAAGGFAKLVATDRTPSMRLAEAVSGPGRRVTQGQAREALDAHGGDPKAAMGALRRDLARVEAGLEPEAKPGGGLRPTTRGSPGGGSRVGRRLPSQAPGDLNLRRPATRGGSK